MDIFLYPAAGFPADIILRDPTILFVVAQPAAGGGGASGLGVRRRKLEPIRREIVAKSLMGDLRDRYGGAHGFEVYRALERERKGPFGPGKKYDPRKRPRPS